MSENLQLGILALTTDMRLFFLSLFQNNVFLGFLLGLVIALLITGFILTQNPRNIPTMLRYSSFDSFQRISSRAKDGTYDMAYSAYLKMYSQIRMLFLIAFIAFCVMITTIVLAG